MSKRKKLLIDNRFLVDEVTNRKRPANGILFNNAVDIFEEVESAIENKVINIDFTDNLVIIGTEEDDLGELDGNTVSNNVTIKEALNELDLSFNYTNLTPVPSDIGGVESGDTFDNVHIKDLLTNILYPYQYPLFTSFIISNYTSARYEVGTTISGMQEFVWNTNNISNINNNSINISYNGIPLVTNIANTGNTILSINVNRTSAGNETWTISGTNSKSESFTRNKSIRWDWRMYWGSSINTSLNEVQIKALQNTKLTPSTITGAYIHDTLGYKYFVINGSYTAPSSFVDVDTGFAVGMYNGYSQSENGYSYDIVPITNSLGVTSNYRVYRTQNQLTSSLNIQIN